MPVKLCFLCWQKYSTDVVAFRTKGLKFHQQLFAYYFTLRTSPKAKLRTNVAFKSRGNIFNSENLSRLARTYRCIENSYGYILLTKRFIVQQRVLHSKFHFRPIGSLENMEFLFFYKRVTRWVKMWDIKLLIMTIPYGGDNNANQG